LHACAPAAEERATEEPWPRLLLIPKMEAFFFEVKQKLVEKQYAYNEEPTF
jgi:hypothetical protein